jgi:glyoxylase-like metal-dependent hydrolase (beta-lactamase superfamily II)
VTVDRISVPVETRAPTGATNAYVVGGDLLVDPAARDDALDAAAADASHLAVTHHHPDHVGAVAAYADDCTVWARTGRVEAFEAATGVAPDRTFREGTVIPAAGGVTVLDTPGHAPEHVAFAAGEALLVGDLAVAEGSVVVGAPAGDVRAYLSSLRRVHARDPATLYPGHGPVVSDPRGTCRRLLDHRLERERRVLAAVESGADSLEAVLDAAYEKDLSGVRDLARATVAAHLEKLAVENRVRRDGDRVGPA